MKKLASLLLVLSLSGCAYSTHMVHVSGFDPHTPHKKGKTISADTEQFVILGFVTQVDYVNKAYKKLQNQCKKGRVSGITTQFSTDLGFFSWTNRIRMKGRCFRA